MTTCDDLLRGALRRYRLDDHERMVAARKRVARRRVTEASMGGWRLKCQGQRIYLQPVTHERLLFHGTCEQPVVFALRDDDLIRAVGRLIDTEPFALATATWSMGPALEWMPGLVCEDLEALAPHHPACASLYERSRQGELTQWMVADAAQDQDAGPVQEFLRRTGVVVPDEWCVAIASAERVIASATI